MVPPSHVSVNPIHRQHRCSPSCSPRCGCPQTRRRVLRNSLTRKKQGFLVWPLKSLDPEGAAPIPRSNTEPPGLRHPTIKMTAEAGKYQNGEERGLSTSNLDPPLLAGKTCERRTRLGPPCPALGRFSRTVLVEFRGVGPPAAYSVDAFRHGAWPCQHDRGRSRVFARAFLVPASPRPAFRCPCILHLSSSSSTRLSRANRFHQIPAQNPGRTTDRDRMPRQERQQRRSVLSYPT